MCGIWGIIFHGDAHSKQEQKLAWLFSSIALEAQVRGTDATGLARIESDGYSTVYKNVVRADTIVKFRRWWRVLCGINQKTVAVLGHTRWGTHGANITENAHPFKFTGSKHTLVGIHNGVISNYKQLGPDVPFENDSANLFWRLSETEEADWPKVLEKVSGSFALAWTAGNTVYLARNSSSPCVSTFIPEINATVFASTEDILRKGAKDAGYSIGPLSYLTVGRIHKFGIGSSVPLTTSFSCGGYSYPTSARAWEYGWEKDEEEMYVPLNRQQQQLCLPPVEKKRMYVFCDTCNVEVDRASARFNTQLSRYECAACATGPRVPGQCDWCHKPATVLEKQDPWTDWLCKPCIETWPEATKSAPESTYEKAKKAEVIECSFCNNEFSDGVIDSQITWSATIGGFVCEDCVGQLSELGMRVND